MPRAMGGRKSPSKPSPKADAAMAMLAEAVPMPGGGEMEMEAEAVEMPAPDGGEDFVMEAQGLLDNWPDKEHPYYKDLEELIMKYSA